MSDFGMLTAITTMVLVAFFLRDLIAVEVLLVPPNYSVSRPADRGWFINPFGGSLSIGAAFGAIIPALLVRGEAMVPEFLSTVSAFGTVKYHTSF